MYISNIGKLQVSRNGVIVEQIPKLATLALRWKEMTRYGVVLIVRLQQEN